MPTTKLLIRNSLPAVISIACALILAAPRTALGQSGAGPVSPQPQTAPNSASSPEQQPATQPATEPTGPSEPDATPSVPGPGAIHVDVNLTLVDVTPRKMDGEVITGLQVNDFVLQEDGQLQQIVHLDQDQLPLAMAVVVDLSTSISPYLESLRDTTEVAMQTLKPEDQVALFTFTDEVVKRVPLTRDKQKVIDALDSLQAGGSTDINDAIYDAAEYLRAQSHGMRRVIVLISDNKGTRAGSVTPDGVLQAVLEADTPVYSLKVFGEQGGGYGGRGGQGGGGRGGGGGGYPGGGGGGGWPGGGGGGGGWPGGGGRGGGGGGWPGGGGGGGHRGGGGGQSQANSKDIVNVEKVADASGGHVFDVKTEGSLDKAFQDFMDSLRTRYTLGYYSGNKSTTGGYRKIDVSLASSFGKSGKDYTLAAKQGYYAPVGTASAANNP
jgi:VWFA-related protein